MTIGIRSIRSEAGAGAVEFLISIPVVLLLILGTLQASLLYQARLQLEVAAQEAARAGALHGGDVGAMRTALARGLTPLYTHGQTPGDLAKARAAAELAAGQAEIDILSPTVEALRDHKEFGRLPLDDDQGQKSTPGGNWGWGIPESHLGYRDTAIKAASGVSVQDANLLKIRVTYHAPMIMPFIDRLFARFDPNNAGRGSVVGGNGGGTGAFEGQNGRISPPAATHPHLPTFPLRAEAIFRMQTPFTHFAGLKKVSELRDPRAGGPEAYVPPKSEMVNLPDYEPGGAAEPPAPEEETPEEDSTQKGCAVDPYKDAASGQQTL